MCKNVKTETMNSQTLSCMYISDKSSDMLIIFNNNNDKVKYLRSENFIQL